MVPMKYFLKLHLETVRVQFHGRSTSYVFELEKKTTNGITSYISDNQRCTLRHDNKKFKLTILGHEYELEPDVRHLLPHSLLFLISPHLLPHSPNQMSTTQANITVNGNWTLRKWTRTEYKTYHNTMNEIHAYHVSRSWLKNSRFLSYFMNQIKSVDSVDSRRQMLTNIDQQRLQDIKIKQTPVFFCCETTEVS